MEATNGTRLRSSLGAAWHAARGAFTSRNGPDPIVGPAPSSTFTRLTRYIIVRLLVLAATLIVGVYVAVVVANLGGFIDEIVQDRISTGLMGMAMGMQGMPVEEKMAALEQAEWAMQEAAGLHRPFLLRCVGWLFDSLTLQWGDTSVLEALPNSLLLFGAASILLFFTSLSLSLTLSRRYGSFVDRIVIALSPLSSAPSWAHGIILVMIFAVELHILPFAGMLDAMPPRYKAGYILVVLKHMILPVLAIFLSMFFQIVYAWRTFLLIHSGEDYVDMATAKGLPSRTIERRHIVRPALPFLITSFALTLITFWQGAIVLEYFFHWPGIGKLYVETMSIRSYTPSVVMNIVVIFAYALALTVFLLDVLYAVVDPRVRVGGQGRSVGPASRGRSVRAAGSSRLAGLRSLLQRQRGPVANPPSVPALRSDVGTAGRAFGTRLQSLRRRLAGFQPILREFLRYPSALVGLVIIVGLVCVSIYTVTAIPYDEAVRLWRGDDDVWRENPALAPPVWVNWFRKLDLPETIIMDSRSTPAKVGGVAKSSRVVSEGMTEILLSFPFEYAYEAFPNDLLIQFDAQYEEKKPLVALTWLTPDGRETELGSLTLRSSQAYYLAQDDRLKRKLKGLPPQEALFTDPGSDESVALQGHYELQITGFVFEEGADLDAKFVLYGQVYGLAGTDHRRRDLMVALLWGVPTALALGVLGAVCSSVATMIIAGISVWFGGWVDRILQAITEVDVILPVLPLGIMVYFVYGKSVWLVLGMVILLSVFGSAIKNYRAAFLQFKESPYIEAAQAYGASNRRVIFRYLIPRIVPVLIPQLVIMVPGYVFLEATLAIVGVSDPVLPTWGKVIYDSLTNGAFAGHYHWLLEPIALLMVTGLAFAMVGFALDRILNPRLRDR